MKYDTFIEEGTWVLEGADLVMMDASTGTSECIEENER